MENPTFLGILLLFYVLVVMKHNNIRIFVLDGLVEMTVLEKAAIMSIWESKLKKDDSNRW